MEPSSNDIWFGVKDFLRQHKQDVAKYIFLSIAAPIGEVVLPHFYGKVIDNLSHHPANEAFSANKSNMIIILGLWLASQAMGSWADTIDTQFVPKMTLYFRDDMVAKILKFHAQKSDDPEIGDLLSKIIRLPTIIKNLFYQIRTYIIPTLLILLFATVYMFYINTELGLLMVAGLIVFGFTLYKFIQESIVENEDTTQKFDALHEEIIDILTNSSNIHNSNMLAEELIRLTEKQEPFNESLKNSIYRISLFKRVFSAAYFAIFTTLSGYTMKLYSENKIDIAATSSVLIVLLFIIINLTDISNGIRDFIFNVSGLINIQNFMNRMSETTKENSVETFEREPLISLKNNSIAFVNATISTDTGVIIVKNLSIHIPQNKCSILKGPVGFGKSTIMKAILKNKKLVDGDIFIGGQSIKTIPCTEIKKYISYVPQNPVLFNRSILDNIVYGTSGIESDVISLLSKYKITEIKPEDLHRIAGKNGNSLSGGQKQIVLILRFLLKKSSIIMLDEPTSNLSPHLKANIIQMLKSINDGTRTILIITHDDSVVSLADNIINL